MRIYATDDETLVFEGVDQAFDEEQAVPVVNRVARFNLLVSTLPAIFRINGNLTIIASYHGHWNLGVHGYDTILAPLHAVYDTRGQGNVALALSYQGRSVTVKRVM